MKYSVLIWFCCMCFLFSSAQPGTTVELKKPEKYESRTLASEKSDTKKFGFGRRAYQNMVTHFNYYFNASNLMNTVIANAKKAHKDDYTKLLSFYDYDLNTTAQNADDIDSVIYHCTAGVLLHDLRNDWIDDLYFLLGKAYYFRKDFDSAMTAFRFVNYAWAPKDEGYDIPIGSNASGNNGEFSIASKEKNDLLHKTVLDAPVRNDNFLWMARTNVDMGRESRAAGLLQILQHDPHFPERLKTSLHEALAYLYYQQKQYDSAAYFLDAALDNAGNRFERARWEYLIAQMYALTGNTEQAAAYFERSAEHTTDPIMEVNAYLHSITIGNDSTGATTQQRLNSLLKLARREKYFQHRDIIYYAAAKVELQTGDQPAAIDMLHKSIRYSMDNAEQKSLSFLLLADLSYDDQQWRDAHRYYDSTQASYLTDSAVMARVAMRQPALQTIAQQFDNIGKEDSLQQVAALPEAQRTAYLKKTLRQIRRSQGLSEEEPSFGNSSASINPSDNLQTQAELFNNPSSSSEWYFNNNGLKSNGFGEFRQRWGNRPNVDDWRRQSSIDQINLEQRAGGDVDSNEPFLGKAVASDAGSAIPETVEDLEAGLPLTGEKMALSNNSISGAYFASGVVFQNELQNYPAAIDMYQKALAASDSSQYTEPALRNLYYCYTKTGDRLRADSALAALKRQFPGGEALSSLQKKDKTAPETSSNNPATMAYQAVYNQFIEGNFSEAKRLKTAADSLYGNSYWTPQLLFIESIYYVSEREDSIAINRLQNLQMQFGGSPLADKAVTMIDVLSRRKEIETYLTNLQISRNEDTSTTRIINLQPVETVMNKPVDVTKDSVAVAPPPVVSQPVIKPDTAAVAVATPKTFQYNAADPQFAVLLLDKVAPVFANEAKNAFSRYNKQKFYNLPQLTITGVKLDDQYNLVLIGPFTDALGAMDYIDKVKPETAGKILPWLTADKFSYLMISEANLNLLNENKDLEGYRKLIEKALPGKF